MESNYFESQEFINQDYALNPLETGEYENCVFNSCNFFAANLSGIRFIDCTFKSSNLSLAKVEGTSFQSVHFDGCKMMGVSFRNCDKFALSLDFTNSVLDDTSFYKLKLKRIRFEECRINNSDFGEVDLTEAKFINCDLKGAIFDQSILTKADFSKAYNYLIDPENNVMKGAKFSKWGLSGLLTKYGIIVED